MTVETAVRARDILAEIKLLTDRREQIEQADLVYIETFINNGSSMTLHCSKEKGTEQQYVKYLLDGIDTNIALLQHELKYL